MLRSTCHQDRSLDRRRATRSGEPFPRAVRTRPNQEEDQVVRGSAQHHSTLSRREEDSLAEAALTGDGEAFSRLTEPYRWELQVHCYRMLGSLDDAEDLVQETFLRAWRGLDGFEGRSTFRTWLYRISTNACLDALARAPRRSRAQSRPGGAEIEWLQPYPDHLLERVAPSHEQPEAVLVAKETVELAFLVAIQHLTPKQRAILILRDVLGWSAKETALLLEISIASANSALQRARPAMKRHLPQNRTDWGTGDTLTSEERDLLRRYMDAGERSDVSAMVALLSEDARLTMPPLPDRFLGRETIKAFTAEVFDPGSEHFHGQWKYIPTRANRQPAAAAYVRLPGDSLYRPQALIVMTTRYGRITDLVSFSPDLFPAFELPEVLVVA